MTPQQLRAQACRVLGANSTRSTAGQLATAIIETIPDSVDEDGNYVVDGSPKEAGGSTRMTFVEAQAGLQEAMARLAQELIAKRGSHLEHPQDRADIELLLRALNQPLIIVQPMSELELAVDKIRLAIENEGTNPYYHRRIMYRHRREWPTLWRAIDALMALHERDFRKRRDPSVT
jgi:hypothetical protein